MSDISGRIKDYQGSVSGLYLNAPIAGAGSAPIGAAGGSLGGTYPSPIVVTNANLTGPVTSVGNATSIGNGVVTNANLANNSITLNGTTVVLGASGSVSANPTGAAGGALTGTYPNPTVPVAGDVTGTTSGTSLNSIQAMPISVQLGTGGFANAISAGDQFVKQFMNGNTRSATNVNQVLSTYAFPANTAAVYATWRGVAWDLSAANSTFFWRVEGLFANLAGVWTYVAHNNFISNASGGSLNTAAATMSLNGTTGINFEFTSNTVNTINYAFASDIIPVSSNASGHY